jgi:hypothetical protein
MFEDKEMKTYWNNNGKYQAEFDSLWKELVSVQGKSKTLEGEFLRAIAKIYYDAYNNGFGNNTSGAYNFLVKKFDILDTVPAFSNLAGIVNFGCVYTPPMTWGETTKILDDAVDAIVEYIVSRNGSYSENVYDMFEFGDEDFNPEEDECEEWEDEYSHDDETQYLR